MHVPATMRALVYRGINDLRLETLPVPRIRPGELLVQVAACGVCPTDLKKIHYGTLPPPRIFGHETAGTIARVGARVTGFRVGDRVALHHHVPCLACHACRHRAYAQCPQYKLTGITAGFEPAGGGFAQYVRVMPFVLPGVVKIPPRNTFAEAALLEPVNTVLKAIRRLQLLPGDIVIVAGQGPIGLLFTKLLSLRQIRVIALDPLPARRTLARQWGAALALDPAHPRFTPRLRAFTGARGADAAILAVPSDAALAQVQAHLRGGGQTLLFAHTRRGTTTPLDLARICVDEQDLLGSYSSDFTLQAEVARLVFRRRLDLRPLVTHQFPLDHALQAIALASQPTPRSLKIIINPNASAERGIRKAE